MVLLSFLKKCDTFENSFSCTFSLVTMADLLAAAQLYLKTSDSQIISSLSDPLPASLLKAFRQSNEYYGNLLQQMQQLNQEIDDHGFRLVSPGGPSVISSQTFQPGSQYQCPSTLDDPFEEEIIDEELVRTLDRDLDLLLLTDDEEEYLASDEEDPFECYSHETLEESMETFDGDSSCRTNYSDDSSASLDGNKMSETLTSQHDVGDNDVHDEFLDSDGWWISEEYFRNSPNAVYIGHEPEFTFRVIEEELSSGPDCIDE